LSDRTGSWCQLQPVAMDRGRVCSSVFAGLSRSIGALGERVGRKWIFLAGLVVFVLGAGSGLRSPDKARLEPQTCPAVAATHTDPSDNPSEVAPVESFSGHPNRKATGCLLVACNRRCCMVSARPTAPGGKGLLGFWASGAVYTRPRSAGRLPRPVPTCTPKEYAGGARDPAIGAGRLPRRKFGTRCSRQFGIRPIRLFVRLTCPECTTVTPYRVHPLFT
jgi:hypothetical protein